MDGKINNETRFWHSPYGAEVYVKDVAYIRDIQDRINKQQEILLSRINKDLYGDVAFVDGKKKTKLCAIKERIATAWKVLIGEISIDEEY